MAAISSHQENEESNPSSSEKSVKKNKGISKIDSEKEDKDTMDMGSMQRVIKHLTNEIIDLKKKKGEGKKPFKPFLKKKTDSTPQIPPTLGINLEYYVMENYCHAQHANHSKRTCLEFINSFTAMLLPPETSKKDRKKHKEEE